MNSRVLRLLGAIAFVVAFPGVTDANAPDGRYSKQSGIVYDSMTKLTWQQAVPAATYTWAAAKTYCTGVGTLLGGTGWRLPTRNELLTIVDYSQTNSSIDPTAFPATPASWFWSSTPLAGSSSYAWFVGFGDGGSNSLVVTGANFIRCVR